MTKAPSKPPHAAEPGSGPGEPAELRTELLRLARERDELRAMVDSRQEVAEWTQGLIERSHLGFFQATEDGRFLRVNQALASMLGYHNASELEQIPIEAIRTEALPAGDAGDGRPPRSAASVQERWRRRDGSELLVRISYLRTLDATQVACEGIVEDVTEQHRQDMFVRRTERLASLGRMLAGVAHELNNPLTAICGFSQLLRKSPLSEDDRSALETIEREGQRAARIVRELLSFARHDGAVRLERVDAAELMRYLARTQRYTLETHGIHCRVEVPDTPLWVEADRGQLEQIVLNLLVNARQACEEVLDERLQAAGQTQEPDAAPPPTVTLAASREGDSVVLEVADTGHGIPANELPHVWEPFWTTKPDGEGSGLGLAVVHAGVTSLGGRIDVRSEQGVGSSFVVRLDAVATPHVRTATGSGQAKGAAQALDILLAGHSPLAEGFVERLLGERGHAVVTAADHAAAERLLQGNRFDVIVLNTTGEERGLAQAIAALREAQADGRARVVVAARRLDGAVRRELESTPGVSVLHHHADMDGFLRAVEGRQDYLRSSDL